MKEKYENRIHVLQEQLDNANAYVNAENTTDDTSVVSPTRPSAFRPIVTDGAPAATGRINSDVLENDGLFDTHNQPLTIDTGGLSFEQLRLIPRGECEVIKSLNLKLCIVNHK